MDELTRLEDRVRVRSRGCQRLTHFQGCSFSDSPPFLVCVMLYVFLHEESWTVLKLKKQLKLSQELGWEVFSPPKISVQWSAVHVCWDGDRVGLLPVWLFDSYQALVVRKRSPWGTVLCHLGLHPCAGWMWTGEPRLKDSGRNHQCLDLYSLTFSMPVFG